VGWQRAALVEQVARFGRHHSILLTEVEEKIEQNIQHLPPCVCGDEEKFWPAYLDNTHFT
jgi:hypothetical protein